MLLSSDTACIDISNVQHDLLGTHYFLLFF